ncbi:uncharacterized protein LOC116267240 [Nymphaea colorata]|nr:uncharacterized protein LOC116267240 [Nymphaea colorata]
MAGSPARLENRLSLLSGPVVDGICRSDRCSHPRLESDQLASDLISSMEALAHQLVFSILEENHHQTIDNPTTHLTNFPEVNYRRSIQGYPWCPYQDFRVTKPVQNVSKPALSSARLLVRPGHLQLKVNGLVSPRLGNQSRGLPFRVVGSGASGFIRESGGTGVFLPRVVRSAEAFCNWKPNIQGRLPSAQGGGEMGRHVGPHSPQRPRELLSPDVALPAEWTY